METTSQQKQLAEAVKKEGSKIKGPSGTLDVYTLPLKTQSMKIEGCKCFIFGKENHGKKNRTIMVLGATGAGKSTLVNRMINYILGVTWDNKFRFKLVDEGTDKSQAHSQTSNVTVYKLNHREGFQINYSLTIVDTPGFGDTRGVERDRLIMSQLENLFSAKSGISEIDAICFVAQASLARLTTTQQYVFDSVLRIFGKDVAENIQILVTFADKTKPLVLGAIKEFGVPCPKMKNGLPIHFKFNNSKIIPDANNEDESNDDEENEGDDIEEDGNNDEDDDDDEERFDKKCWDMGTKNMKKLFSALNVIETKSLTLSKEVLRQRAQLEISIENIQIKVKMALTKLGEIKKESQILKEHKSAIKDNSKFEYEVSVTRPVKVQAEEFSLNCEKCDVTCHKSCGVIFGWTYFCEVFTWGGYCNECKGKCHVMEHDLKAFYWDSETVMVKKTFEKLKENYEMASKKAMSVEDIIEQMMLKYHQLEDEVVRLMERSAQCLNTLKEIALRPDPISTPEYIDLLIEGEKSEGKPGYPKRIKKLLDLKKKATTMGEVASGATVYSILRPDSQVVGTSPSANPPKKN
ncbi:uncharacterized protein LOC115548207 [Gadus morhua]|uniref:uncharacterized protein LOC115548207 n=1 Tax=Gadus morhua TaxID=8049 RepID=UPI0011B3604E|nr:uncharacterized protein LOC115548207 [Gadus morhua]